jgi:hypothetical protein
VWEGYYLYLMVGQIGVVVAEDMAVLFGFALLQQLFVVDYNYFVVVVAAAVVEDIVAAAAAAATVVLSFVDFALMDLLSVVEAVVVHSGIVVAVDVIVLL